MNGRTDFSGALYLTWQKSEIREFKRIHRVDMSWVEMKSVDWVELRCVELSWVEMNSAHWVEFSRVDLSWIDSLELSWIQRIEAELEKVLDAWRLRRGRMKVARATMARRFMRWDNQLLCLFYQAKSWTAPQMRLIQLMKQTRKHTWAVMMHVR